jgi:hypothetical protein
MPRLKVITSNKKLKKVKQSHYRPGKDLRVPDFKTFGT